MYTTYPGLLTQDEYHECFQILQDKEGWSSRGSSVGNGNCFMYKDLGSYPPTDLVSLEFGVGDPVSLNPTRNPCGTDCNIKVVSKYRRKRVII